MEKPTPDRAPITHRFRMVLWVAIAVVPVFLYPLLAWIISSRGYEGQTPYSDSIIGAFVALGIIVFFSVLALIRRGIPDRDDRGFIMSLAMAEAIGIEGFVLYLIIGWNWGFWAMLIMSLLAGLPLRPRRERQ
ncbi:MAG: hypothetical protein ACYC6T_05270 [Thermoleophilia bacterium]